MFGIDGVFSPLLLDGTIVMNYSEQKNVGPENGKSSSKTSWNLVPSFQGGLEIYGMEIKQHQISCLTFEPNNAKPTHIKNKCLTLVNGQFSP